MENAPNTIITKIGIEAVRTDLNVFILFSLYLSNI